VVVEEVTKFFIRRRARTAAPADAGAITVA
jgi:hypothetical protein